MHVLAPALLWAAAALLYAAWWRGRTLRPPRVHAPLRAGGVALALVGTALAIAQERGPGAGLAAALAHLSAAASALALLAPLTALRPGRGVALACVAVGVLTRASVGAA